MPKCSKCASEVPASGAFCPRCGARIIEERATPANSSLRATSPLPPPLPSAVPPVSKNSVFRLPTEPNSRKWAIHSIQIGIVAAVLGMAGAYSDPHPQPDDPPAIVMGMLGGAGIAGIVYLCFYLRRCPKCRKFPCRTHHADEEVARQEDTQVVLQDEVVVRDANYKRVASYARPREVPVVRTAYRKMWRCRYCGHIWPGGTKWKTEPG